MTFKATTDACVNHRTNEIEWWNPLELAAKEKVPLTIQDGSNK